MCPKFKKFSLVSDKHGQKKKKKRSNNACTFEKNLIMKGGALKNMINQSILLSDYLNLRQIWFLNERSNNGCSLENKILNGGAFKVFKFTFTQSI